MLAGMARGPRCSRPEATSTCCPNDEAYATMSIETEVLGTGGIFNLFFVKMLPHRTCSSRACCSWRARSSSAIPHCAGCCCAAGRKPREYLASTRGRSPSSSFITASRWVSRARSFST